MGTVSYPNADVVSFVNDNLIPLRVLADAQPISTDFNVNWTPTIVTLDTMGREHHRTLGFLPPEEFIPSLMLGIGKTHFDMGRFDEANSILEELTKKCPQSRAAPEAIYYLGVSSFKIAHDASHLKKAYERLKAEYPDNEWAFRAWPYSLL
ncbi:MAG: tetratricopeptide repeat protein [Thermodesulfobacteriota bacterium]